MSSYLARLLLLSSASFFLVQLVVGAAIAWLAPAAIRRAGNMRPLHAARFLLTLRLLPTALAIIVVAVLCVPSYLRFEPRAAEEEVGFVCLAAAVLGAMFCSIAVSRAVVALDSLFTLCAAMRRRGIACRRRNRLDREAKRGAGAGGYPQSPAAGFRERSTRPFERSVGSRSTA